MKTGTSDSPLIYLVVCDEQTRLPQATNIRLEHSTPLSAVVLLLRSEDKNKNFSYQGCLVTLQGGSCETYCRKTTRNLER